MALVIFCVALTEAMRLRRSFKLGIERPYLSGDPGSCENGVFTKKTLSLRERLGEVLDHVLELRFRVARQILRGADRVQDVGVLAAQQREQTILESAHAIERERIEVAVHAGV